MEASAVRAPSGLGRIPGSPTFLRLRSDDQLVALFRHGTDEAFQVIHDRYRQRLFAYVRQMLGPRSRQDAEDILQDVFVRAFGGLRADDRPLVLRAWLYRVAHNRCVDVLRRTVPAPADIFDVSRTPLHDPIEQAQRREDLARLVRDLVGLPEHQRSALLMREIDGLPYVEIAEALGVTVPAVKSLLVRARMGLVEAQEARELDCGLVRGDLAAAYERGVKSSARARRHMRECGACREYRTALRGMRRSFAALSPAGLVPLAVAAKALGLGGAGGGAAAGGSAAGGVAALAGGGAAAATACKVAAVVCTAAIGAGSAVEVHKLVRDQRAHHPAPAAAVVRPEPRPLAPALNRLDIAPPASARAPAPAPASPRTAARRPAPAAPAPAPRAPADAPAKALTGAPAVVPVVEGAAEPIEGGAVVDPLEPPPADPAAPGEVHAPAADPAPAPAVPPREPVSAGASTGPPPPPAQ